MVNKKKVKSVLLELLNMPEYTSICLNKQGFEYANVLNMPEPALSTYRDRGVLRTFSDS